MALKEKINDDIKAALLGGNRFRAEVLKSLKASILNQEIANNKRENGLDDSEIEQVISKEVKKRQESANIYENAGRLEIAEKERSEAQVLIEYLPEQLSENDLIIVINRIISELNVLEISQIGQVIGAVKKELGNSADGAIIARLAKEALNK